MSRDIAVVVATDMPSNSDPYQRGTVTVSVYAAGPGRGIGVRLTLADEYVKMSAREAAGLRDALAVAVEAALGYGAPTRE